MKKVLKAANTPPSTLPYSPGLQIGNTVYVSGQLPMCPKTGKLETEIKAATKLMFQNMEAVLKEANMTMENVVKVTVFMSDLEMYNDMNAVYAECFNAPYPTRSCVQVARLPRDAIIEAECIAMQ